MKNIRPEVVTKGKVLVEMAHCGGELNGYIKVIDLIVAKMDDAQGETYGVLADLLELVSDNYNQVNILEEKANEKLKDILDKKIASSDECLATEPDNA
ncbi:hypothetical protein NGC89_06405 [Staphylococcus xylosus]|uniref:hypothetical protein n=1 Tax=Staphylococcus xylosus TaxID=1288 RepID=UPI002DB91D81|nr:hypothetical protein [Staphylococcus xylosus]MEB7801080.1 hypothetical protein [Staphylococcus xylosus]